MKTIPAPLIRAFSLAIIVSVAPLAHVGRGLRFRVYRLAQAFLAAVLIWATPVCLAAVSVSISPTGTQTVTTNQTITYSSTATDSAGLLEAHSFEWQDPDGNWSSQGTATGLSLSADRTLWFNPSSSSSRSIVATPTRAGTFNIKWSALQGGIGWTDSSTYQLVVTAGTAPTITAHPVAVTRNVSFDVMFGVSATGTTPFTYQWKKNGTNISGATGATLTLLNISTADAASYSVVVSNSAGSATSNSGALTVVDPNADSDGDGIPNLTETALGTSASTTSSDGANTQQQNIHRPGA